MKFPPGTFDHDSPVIRTTTDYQEFITVDFWCSARIARPAPRQKFFAGYRLDWIPALVPARVARRRGDDEVERACVQKYAALHFPVLRLLTRPYRGAKLRIVPQARLRQDRAPSPR